MRTKVSDNHIIVGYRNGLLYRKENAPDNDSWDELNYIEYQVGLYPIL